MTRAAALVPAWAPPAIARVRSTVLTMTGADAGTLRALFGLSLGISVAVAPFETLALARRTLGVALTDLEVASYATLLVWAVVLARERRLPDVPRPVAAALLVVVTVSLASALAAGAQAAVALASVRQSAGFWLLFVAAADVVRTERSAVRIVGWALAGATAAAAIGWTTWLRGGSSGLGMGNDFTIGGALRVDGPLGYPTTAGMVWEATLVAALPWLLRRNALFVRVALATALVLVGGAMVLTLSRGAVLGAVGALTVMIGLALATRRPRPALLLGPVAVALAVGLPLANALGGLPPSRLLAEGDRGLYGATYEAPDIVRLDPASVRTIPVAVTNTGVVTWALDGSWSFRVGYHWLDAGTGAVLLHGEGTALPRPVAPGERVEVAVLVRAPPTAGVYSVAWDMVRQGGTWLSERGVPAWATRAEVGIVEAGTAAVSGPVEVFPGALPSPTRAELWRAAWGMVRQEPLLGVGPGVFRETYGAYLDWPRWDARIHANSLYVELVATTGLLGLAAFLGLLIAALVPQLRRMVRGDGSPAGSNDAWLIRLGLLGAVAAFLAHGVVDYFLGFGPTATLFFVLLGVGVGLSAASARPAGEATRVAAGAAS